MELKIEHLSKQFKDKTAVNDVNLTLTPGVWGLLGANGAGKTTLMRMIADIMTPTNGAVYYDGKDIRELGEVYRSKFGFLPQDFGYHRDFTVKDYLEYMAALKDIPTRATTQKINHVGKHGVEQIPCFYVVCSTHAISISGIIIAGILYTVDNIGTFPPVYARCPQSITAIGTLNYACKNIFKSSRIFFPPAARHKPLDSIKFLLRDYPLMSIGYHFPFFGQLRKAFPAFHAGGNPFVACKVSRIYRT